MKKNKFFSLHAVVRKKTEIFITDSFWKYLQSYIKKHNFTHVVYITDDIIASKFNFLDKIQKRKLCVLQHGEYAKNIEQFEKILTFFYEANIDKSSLIVVIGGGMVTDVSGFAASVYYRGVPLVYVPTTLLSQVDAAIGGKNTINFHETKNLIGTVYLPQLIIVDPSFITSLPKKELSSGMAEIIKYAVGFDKRLFRLLEKMNENNSELFDLIARSIEIKIHLVEKDLYEEGKKRRLLNLGHTLGQALESQHGYALSHGHAVSIGLLFSLYISFLEGNIKKDEFDYILQIFRKYDLPPKITFSINETMQKMRYDKKSHGDKIDFILIKNIGKSYICQIRFDAIQSFLKKFQSFYYSL